MNLKESIKNQYIHQKNGCCNWCEKSIRKENKYFCNMSCRAKHRNKYNNPSKYKIGKYTKFHKSIRSMIDGVTKTGLNKTNHFQDWFSEGYTKEQIEEYNFEDEIDFHTKNKWDGSDPNAMTIEHKIPIKILYEIFDLSSEILCNSENIIYLPMRENIKENSKFNYKKENDVKNILRVLDIIKQKVMEKK